MKRGEQIWVLRSKDDEMRRGDGFFLYDEQVVFAAVYMVGEE